MNVRFGYLIVVFLCTHIVCAYCITVGLVKLLGSLVLKVNCIFNNCVIVCALFLVTPLAKASIRILCEQWHFKALMVCTC